MKKYIDLLLSQRVLVAIVGAVVPVVAHEVFGLTITAEQLTAYTAMVMALIGGISYRAPNAPTPTK
jgi:uncharacterized membrane protein